MERYLLRISLLVLCASCDSAGLPKNPPPAGDTQVPSSTSVTFHITNATAQTLYVDTTGNGGVGGFDIGPNAGCGCSCGHCSSCENCSPPSPSVRALGAGESFDLVIGGQVWTWGNGCGERGCASPSASAKGLTASVSYSTSYLGLGESPTTVANGPSGGFGGALELPISTAQATFDYPQADIVNIELTTGPTCQANQVATKLYGCAVECMTDGGIDGGACPTGTTCKSVSAACQGTACKAPLVEACIS